MTKPMRPRQTLLDCARNKARSLSNKHKYDFFDRLDDFSLQIAASGGEEKLAGCRRLERFEHRVVEHVETPHHNNFEFEPLC